METCGIILGSLIGGGCLLAMLKICYWDCNCLKEQSQRQVAPHPDCIVITKEHYENLKRLGPPEYIGDPTGDPPVYDEPESLN